MPFIFAALLIAGMFIGKSLDFSGNRVDPLFVNKRTDAVEKLSQIIRLIDKEYVDTINKEQLVEKSIINILQGLDPHSTYISPKDLQGVNESLEGNFQGIGIEFNIFDDTIRVVSVIKNGPSDKAGLKAGDKIIKVEDKIVAGKKIKNKDVTTNLRGEEGTKVNVTILRGKPDKLYTFAITRGEIPLYSVDASYMLDEATGYIKLNRFAETSYDEFMTAIKKLRAQHVKNLILDLRDNGGGLLNAAVSISDEFLEKDKLIVYTQGKSSPKKIYKATQKGALSTTPLILLVDENSASASEILAGAIQDNDRGTLIGRRTFGKGLVQQQTELPDGSAIRLTTARYYTPTGRCIQKSYSKGLDAYIHDERDRFVHGEFQNADSNKFADSLKFKTPKGKTVYGGGGIMPDVFIPLDTAEHNSYLTQLLVKNLFVKFAFDYIDTHRGSLERISLDDFANNYSLTPEDLTEFYGFTERNGIKKNTIALKQSRELITSYLKSAIARSIWGNNGFYRLYNLNDKALQAAKQIFTGL
jgi:carboxyl-terminal processing protease